MTPRNYAGTDILALNPQNGKTVEVQVKTAGRDNQEWFMRKKVVKPERIWVLVALAEGPHWARFYLADKAEVVKRGEESVDEYLRARPT